jgi:hypothetical protein
MSCCILHNWIFGWGIDSFFLDGNDVQPDKVVGHGVVVTDNATWKNKSQEWADAMWADKGHTRI